MSRTALMTTPLPVVEMMFGPVLPGTSTPDRTISIFRDRFSRNNYQMFGQVGIFPDALFYVHTQIPIDLTKVKSNIIGVTEEANSDDEAKMMRVSKWLAENAPQLNIKVV